MNRRGHAGRVDANHVEIVKALRAIGYSVQSLASVGGGTPDLLVGHRGKNVLIEIKASPKHKLTDDEIAWHARWAGKVAVACSVEDAVEIVSGAREGFALRRRRAMRSQ